MKKSILAIILGVVFVACEKEAVITETVELNEEGFTSETGNYDQILGIKNEDIELPLFHMSFDKNTSAEDAELFWNEAVRDYVDKNSNQNKGYSREWYYSIVTTTGDGEYHPTGGQVQVEINFNMNTGSIHSGRIQLDNPGVIDRRRGQTDYYLFRASVVFAIQWVEVEHAHLYLEGIDGWFPTQFSVSIWPYDQTVPASSDPIYIIGSHVTTAPNIWLDNINPNTWDRYDTGNIGIGRVTF